MAPGPSLTAAVVSASPTIATFHRAGESAWLAAFRPLARWGISHVDLRVAVSEEARAMAHEALGGDYEVLWNGIETGRYQSTPPHPGGKRAVFFVGRHESRKGLEVLIDAVGRIGGDVVLWIAGVGPDTARLRRDTAGDERFQWLGVLDEAEKISRIRGADVVCAPSLHGESFGVVLLEALAAGTPLVATDLAGYRSVVTDGVEGRLVPPGDPAALARAIGQALEGGGETAAMVEAGLLRAERFSMDSLADAYLERYERLTKP
jgi:phosphatidylinositol alpha-mannosyltransferase